MCGIAGVLAAPREQARTVLDVQTMIDTLTHRGPDDSGVAAGEGWALGMRRLAVQDVSHAGHQPMSVRDLSLVFNGEVYNFPELRRELERVGYSFNSGCDTEVVLYALERWGAQALTRFNGMFALALVDDRRRTAWVARDRFGKKPLFVAKLRRGVAFASELKAIIAIAREELTIDREALSEYFRMQYVPTPMCIFEQVRKLPPASWMQIDLESGDCSEANTFWALPRPSRRNPPAAPEDMLEVVRESVKRRLLADVPVGAFLSGGADSSLVVACMRDLRADVRTFSIGFSDPRFDESRYALAVARHLQTHHTHVQLEPAQAMSLLPSLAHAYDEPFADSSAIPTLAVSRLAREDVTVALSGDGGDELFGGYTRYRLARALALVGRLPRAAGSMLRPLASQGMLGRHGARVAALMDVFTAADAYRELVSIWRSRELERLMPGAAWDRGFEHSGAWTTNGCGPVERVMRCDARTYLIDDILQKVDRATMSVSLEARNPLLDPDVVSLAFASSALAESAPGRKPLLRAALKLRLPERLVERPKMGFGVPVADWMRVELRSLVEDLILGRTHAEYDTGVAHDLCQRHLSGEQDAGAQLWSLLAFELWRQRWLSGQPASP
jgi:asparagine synthase (glutamine-hydrolysing)